ncbi:MAG: GUN4 domain-containing protein [Symploca sp. SIO2E9]|nr:GUN4 domain-containing protein [Symploca sp. SIO2E9]
MRYRLLNSAESKQHPISEEQLLTGRGIRLVRFKLPSRYGQLAYYLAAGEWKKADQKTAQIMLQVAGREEEDYLRLEDIEKFPCADLGTIDQLWVKYSEGRFGFSVQKRIWQEVGGKVDYSTECKLGDRVGWRKGGNWLNYQKIINFTHEAPVGILPCWYRYVTRLGRVLTIRPGSSLGINISLVQRAVTCSI